MASMMPATNPTQAQPAAAAVVVVPQQVATQLSPKQQKHQENLKGLAITEVVLGVSCVVLGAVVSGIVSETRKNYFNTNYNSHDSLYNSNFYYSYRHIFTTGEGIWCGVWIIIAGVLGIFAAKKTASRCLIGTHLGFSVVASIACGSMIIVAFVGLAHSYYLTSALVIYIILGVIAFISMLLHIISASVCYATLACCSCSNTNYTAGQPVAHGGQVIYHPQPVQPAMGVGGVVYGQQVPAIIQYPGAPNFQQGYVYPGGQPMMQTTFPGTVAPSTNVPPNQPQNLPVAGQENATAPETKVQEALQLGGGDLPPSYNATTDSQ